MSHSYYRVWIHAVWATKNRKPVIFPDIEPKVYSFLKNQLQDLKCPVYIINGMPEHIHCLFLQNPNKTIAEVMKQIKGSSSHYINENKFLHERFSWQVGYGIFSVSDMGIDNVYRYIANQKRHHQKYRYIDEYEELLKLHNSNVVQNIPNIPPDIMI